MVSLEDLSRVKLDELIIYLSKIGKSLKELTIADLLKIIEEQNFLKKPYPEPRKIPVSMEGRKVYLNLYTVEYSADRYEGSITQTYSCYSLDEPVTDPSILEQHHRYFYPDHDIIWIEYDGSYERENFGRAKLVYDPRAGSWVKLED